MTQKLKLTQNIINKWYEMNCNTKKLSTELNINYFALVKTIKTHIDTLSIDDLTKLYDNIEIDFKFLSHKNKMYQQITQQTMFLEPKAPIRQRMFHIKYKTITSPVCKRCNNNTKWDYTEKRYRKYCSIKCQANDPDVINSKIITNTKNLGVEYPAQSSTSREKYKQTMLSKYGITHVNQTLNSIVLDDKQLLTTLYDTNHLSTFQIAEKYNVSQSHVAKQLQKYNIVAHEKSSLETHIIQFIHEITSSPIITNSRKIIQPKELDIFLPNNNIAIECDGLFWHSEVSGNKNKNYHLQKTISCQQQNIMLIHVFENEWFEKQEIVKSRIKSLLNLNCKIYARKCKIVQLTSKQAELFYNTNHIQGSTKNKFNYGLTHNDTIVACMSFNRPRFSKKYEIELTRYCSLKGYNVVGGASKLFKHFIDNTPVKNIVSYSDKRWSVGKLYTTLNFKFSHSSKPNYWYFTNSTKLYSRIQFQKHKLKNLLNTFDPTLSEWENMKNNEYDRIWDCGNDVWVWKRT